MNDDARWEFPEGEWAPAGQLTQARGAVWDNGFTKDGPLLACWHAETDTLPWVQNITDEDGAIVDEEHVDVFLPVGIFSRVGEVPDVTVGLSVAGGQRHQYSNFDRDGLDVVRPEFFEGRLQKYRGHVPWRALDERHHRVDLFRGALDDVARKEYYLLRVRVERDAELDYVVSATTPMLQRAPEGQAREATSAFTLRASAPTFDSDSLVAVEPSAEQLAGKTGGLDRWVLLRRDAGELVHLRLDFLSTILPGGRAAERPQIRVQIGNTVLDLGESRDHYGARDRVPLVLLDRDADSVLLSVRREDLGENTVDVQTGGPAGPVWRIDPHGPRLRRVRFAIVNFAIQGHNDLFAVPRGPYEPPRTYMQLTMRDEQGVWSSRPGSNEDGEPDGYALTLAAHRHYGIPAMWAFNAGVLTMIAHDCPKDLQEIRGDVADGVLVPINPGFGAHRPPFYRPETNIEEIRRGAQIIAQLLPEAAPVGLRTYHPDQRLYEARDAEVRAYTARDPDTDEELVQYVVLDRSGLCHNDGVPPGNGPGRGPTQTRFFADAGLPADRVHHDPHTNTRILPIEDVARNSFMGDDDDAERGKAGYDFRALVLGELSRLNAEGTPADTPQVIVYGDDADKASGCGWFDGDYAGHPLHFDETYQAALCWLKRHPWVEVVTVVDLASGGATELEAPLWSASCPSVDPSAATGVDLYRNVMHFDTWYQKCAAWRSPWLGRPLGDISTEIEEQLVGATGSPDLDEELVDVAWMSFLALNHEMYWNKEALEGGLVDQRLGVLSPEDFVIAAGLHLGLTRLYLCAARWAMLAPTLGPRTRVCEGELVEDLRQRGLAGADGLHWDDDLLPNDVLYNGEVLVVLDRNGGRAVAVFAVTDDGRAICVSGTPKAFQWTQPDPQPDPEIENPVWLNCDGDVLENSVLTPNHVYVASDLNESRPRIGWHHEDRARQTSPQRWLYADTFDEYDAVRDPGAGAVKYAYAKPSGVQPVGPVEPDDFHGACEQDRDARNGGGERVVWHSGGLDFSKTISLDGRRIRVEYDGVPAGHCVGNEFSVDLHASMTGQGFHGREVDARAGTVTLRGALRGSVTVAPGRGCGLSPASLLETPEQAAREGMSVDFLRLHRVLTDAVEVRCPDGGGFEYTIDIGR